MQANEDISVTVIIPVFNGSINLRYCLESLFNSHFRDFEVILVDDCSSDNSLKIAMDFNCRTIRLNKRSGPAAARNKGAQIAKGRILVFLDCDVICEPGTLENLIAPLEKEWDACVGMYQPVSGYNDFFSMYKNIFIWHYHNTSDNRIDWFWTACGAVKKNIFDALGGFNESFTHKSVEDIDFGYRMTKNNYRILLEKKALARHFHRFGLMGVLINDFKKSRDWTYFNLTSNRSLALKHPAAQFKYRGLGVLTSLLFILILFLSTFRTNFFPVSILLFLTLPFIEKGFFSSLLRYGNVKYFIPALFFKPVDDLIICMGAFTGLTNFCAGRSIK